MHEAAAGEAIAASTPEDGAARIAGCPAEESDDVAKGIKEHGTEKMALLHGKGSDECAEDHALDECVGESVHSENRMMQSDGCPAGEDAEWHAESERRSEMAEWAREAGGFHPASLVLQGGNQAVVEDNVVDDVMGEDDGFTLGGNVGAENEVVRAPGAENAKTAHPAHAAAAHGHCGAEGELHPFKEARGKDAGGHFDGHAGGFKA